MNKKSESLADKAKRRNAVAQVSTELKRHEIEHSLKDVSENLEKWQEKLLQIEANPDALSKADEEVIVEANKELEKLVNEVNGLLIDRSCRKVSMYEGVEVESYLVVVPHDRIEEWTEVAVENDRNQEALNETTLAYILKTLFSKGQLFAAEGEIDSKTGKITVWDGSSRRASCLLANKPFKIWVTEQNVTSTVRKTVGEIANVNKQLSIWEQGTKYEQEFSDYGGTLAEYAALKGTKPPRMSVYMNAVVIPMYILNSFPSKTSISRAIIEKLIPLNKLTQDHEGLKWYLSELEGEVANDKQALSLIVNYLAIPEYVLSCFSEPNRLDRTIIERLVPLTPTLKVDTEVRQYVGDECVDSTDNQEVIELITERCAKIDPSGGKSDWKDGIAGSFKISSDKQKNTMSILIKKTTPETMMKIELFIEKLNS